MVDTNPGLLAALRDPDAGVEVVGEDALMQQPGVPEPASYAECRITLAAVATAVGCARTFVRLMLQRWGLGALVEIAELVASELVTNAVKATGVVAPGTALGELRGVHLIRVQVTAYQGSAFVSVWDGDRSPPAVQDAAWDAEGGRGLWLVAGLCRRWSWYPSPRGGKVVWGEVAPPPPQTAAGLPQRQPRRCSPRPAEAMRDRATLLRVLHLLPGI